MADFCRTCLLAHFGDDTKDLANLMPPEKYTEEVGALALCECCGPIVVDIEGQRMSDFDPTCDCASMRKWSIDLEGKGNSQSK